MKETIKPSESTKTSGVNALPSNRKEQIDKFTDGIVNRIIPIVNQALINKDKTIVELVQKIADLEKQNQDLDYLLDSRRNKFEHEWNKKLTKIQGILTSNLRSRTSSSTPYMAFLRLETADFTNHSLAECSATKCKDCEIPVIFRLKEAGVIHKDEDTTLEIRPKLKKGKKVILEGQWAKSNGNRPSFTCYSYRVLEGVDK